MKKLVGTIAAIALLSPCTHALQLNPKINSTITVNACVYKRTNNTLDMALINRGYFVIGRGKNQLFYSRDGRFMLNSNTEVVNSFGDKVMGLVQSPYNYPRSITLPTENLKPNPTSSVSLAFNLPSESMINEEYWSTSVVYDVLGSSHILKENFIKINNNTWKVNVAIDDQLISNGELKFNKDGTVNTDLSIKEVKWASPYDKQIIQLNFSAATQYAYPFQVNSVKSDGYPMGSLTGLNITADGEMVLQYSNGQTKTLEERIAVATFDHPEYLTPIVDGLFLPSEESGTATLHPENGDGVFLIGFLEKAPCLPQM